MTALDGNDMIAILGVLKESIAASRDRLIELDSALGDGDLGITITRGFTEICTALNGSEEHDVGKILIQAGMVLAKTAPSTMGTLLAGGFMNAGKAIRGSEEITLEGLLRFFEEFTGGISARGKAVPGDKTIIDALTPAVQELRNAVEKGKSLGEGLADACRAAETGAESTINMVAKHGRPSYYGENSVGKEDPGAAVGVLIMRAFAAYMKP
ncbi:dihydroxyacetone kinase subunit L [bacterium]|nr:dihydroxyacetone kinase subunit L [bacterium]